MAIKLAVTEDHGEFHVWAMLDDDSFNADPTTRGESFVVGYGETLLVAIDKARKEFEHVVGQLDVLFHDKDAREAMVRQR